MTAIRTLAAAAILTAIAGCSAQQMAQLTSVSADIQAACADVLPFAQLASLIPGAGSIAAGVTIGCRTVDGLARLAADPTSAEWLGMQRKILESLLARTTWTG